MTKTNTILVSLDAICIGWVIVVVLNPFDYLCDLLTGLLQALGIALAFVPPAIGLLLAVNGVDEIAGKVMLMYLVEVFGCIVLLVSLFSLRGVFSLVRSVAAIYQLMISVPCWFVLGTIAYWSW